MDYDKETLKRGLRLAPAERTHFISVYQGDCLAVVNELDKRALAANAVINAPDQLMAFFPAIQALARRDASKKFTALEQLLYNEDVGRVFNILAYSVSGKDQLKMADYDAAVKSGKLDYEEALLDFLINEQS